MPVCTENFCAQSISDCTGQIAVEPVDIIQQTLNLPCSHKMRNNAESTA